ncbi:pre-mRNA-splicing factor 18 isoform X1 [Hemicordylus capensis]|uniref:pre-mRNA-splicing factor 18 isoform X1 n=1 Tax=Hemicordylus capensis TaxID=884348 RepID=UPI002304A560|nr:pre-mRNA-splicing factor 18 isoform X1 [Hemicordylus capensis]
MDVLKAEIERKRKLMEEKELVGGNKKYFKRSELAKKEEEAYFERCGYKPVNEKPPGEVQQEEEEEEKTITSSNPVLELELAEEKLPMTLSRQEVIRRLRERGEPIRLFGETDYDAFQRLRKIEILAPEVNKGLRNDLKAALDKIDQQYLNEIVGGQEQGEDDTQNDLKVHEENTTIEELEVLKCYFTSIMALGESLGQGDDHKDMDIITKFLKFLLGVWAKELNAREDYVKRGVQGKLNSATQKQTESYLRPLFRKLRKRTIPADIKESITDIIKFMLQREYVKANDAYLQMAIGNAPWPIGVTMVGIHARTGREKIFSKHVAHVLNDETQRKYIQGLKRLMTICQKHFPTDPSKCVEYNAL